MKLFIFGSTGDLVKRKVLPALQDIKNDGLEVWALGRRDFTDEVYSDFVCQGRCSPEFRKRIFYRRIELENENLCEDCMEAFDKKETNYFYISFPPELIKKTLESILYLKKNGIKVKVLIEKPFGRDLKEAESLGKFIERSFDEEEIFLSDHYLFKDSIINLGEMNFKKLKIVSLESVGLEGRNYYDSAGALKDMVQSHFLNIALKLAGKLSPDEIKIPGFERFQYKDYEEELGRKSAAETLVKLKIKARDKEFEFITGKAFDKKISFMEIDGRRIELEDKTNPYQRIFSDFFEGKKGNFPAVSNAVSAWKITEEIEKKKPKLKFYKKGISADEFLKEKEN